MVRLQCAWCLRTAWVSKARYRVPCPCGGRMVSPDLVEVRGLVTGRAEYQGVRGGRHVGVGRR